MTEWFVNNTGGGTGLSSGSRKTFGSLWGSGVNPGDLINVATDVFTGINSMIQPTPGLSGISGSPIIIRAEVDGGPRINGQGSNTPIYFRQNNHWELQGFNFHASNGPAAYIYQSNSVKFRRMIGWDAAIGNNHVFSWDQSDNGLTEDCAGWGQCRKVFEFFIGQNNTRRRCYGRKSDTDTVQTGGTAELNYRSNTTITENCIFTWSIEIGTAPGISGAEATVFASGETNGGSDNIIFLGSLVFLRANRIGAPEWNILISQIPYVDVTVQDVISYIQNGVNPNVVPWVLANPKTRATAQRITSYGNNNALNNIQSNWTVTDHLQTTSTPNIFTGSQGGQMCYRYIDGLLTTQPLWPWPMDQRIKDALAISGYHSATAGFNNNTGLLTDAIEEMFGTIPSVCRTDGTNALALNVQDNMNVALVQTRTF